MEQTNFITNQEEIQTKKARIPFRHLCDVDRKKIQELLRRQKDKSYQGPKITLRYIAAQVGFNVSTISREIKKGLSWGNVYSSGRPCYEYFASLGQAKINDIYKKRKNQTKLSADDKIIINLRNVIRNEKVSPEQAVKLIEEATGLKFPVSLKTIYKYINNGILKLSKKNLRRKKAIITEKQPKTAKRLQKGTNISERSEENEKRLEFGHWEGDTIVGKRGGGKECLFTLVERKTRISLAFVVPDKSAASIVSAINTIEETLNYDGFTKLFKTITFDNGTEFAKFMEMEQSSTTSNKRLKTYFANPYHSWERGSNELTNGWIRFYLPKGTSFEGLPNSKLFKFMSRINYNTRHIFNGNSSIDKLKQEDENLLPLVEKLGIINPFQNIMNYLIA